MRSINKVFVIGNLTRTPNKRTTQNGETVVTFGVATNREWVAGSGHQNSTEFHEVVAWAKLGEICAKYLNKGSLIFIEGYIKTRKWEGEEEGQKKFKTEIIAQNVINLDKKDQSEIKAIEQYQPIHKEETPIEKPLSGHNEKGVIPPHDDHDAPKDSIIGKIDIDADLGL